MQIMNIKKAAIYGDSISTTGYPCGGYGTLLGEKLGIETVYNHAIGASGLTEGTPNNLVQLLEDPLNLHEDVDLAILWHGTNDWYWGAPVGIPGTADMRNPKTYVGALTEAVTRIRAAAPRARILAMTPLWRVETPDGNGNTDRIQISGSVDTKVPGTYYIRYEYIHDTQVGTTILTVVVQ